MGWACRDPEVHPVLPLPWDIRKHLPQQRLRLAAGSGAVAGRGPGQAAHWRPGRREGQACSWTVTRETSPRHPHLSSGLRTLAHAHRSRCLDQISLREASLTQFSEQRTESPGLGPPDFSPLSSSQPGHRTTPRSHLAPQMEFAFLVVICSPPQWINTVIVTKSHDAEE